MDIYKERFKKVVAERITRDGIDELMESLEGTDFYTAPASTRYHDSHEAGLVKHSLAVFDILDTDLKFNDDFNKESIAIVSLFHDLCKVGFYKVSTRNTKDENGRWVQVPYYEVDDQIPLGHGDKSIMLIRDFMKLTLEEMIAIRWHMNGFVPKEDYQTLGKAYADYPLAVWLATADLKATYLL